MCFTISHESTSQCTNGSSPGVVRPDEILLRLGFHPEQTEDGKILPSAISTEDLKHRGFSVDRKQFVSLGVLKERALKQMSRKETERKTALISSFSCREVRNLTDKNGRRALIVIDTALPDNPAHACIYSAYEKGPGGLKGIRRLLLPLLQEYVAIDEFLQANPDIV